MLKIISNSKNSSSNALRKNMKVGQNIKKMVMIILSVLYITHIVSCFFFFMPKMLDFPVKSWVWQKDLIDSDHYEQYLVAFYWALQTILTIGYGDVVPKEVSEQLFACCWMLFGLNFYSYLFGIMYQMINDYDKDNELLQADIEVL